MTTFSIDIYRELRDWDTMKSNGTELLFSGDFETDDSLDKVVSYLHKGEGISIDVIEKYDDLNLITFTSLFGSDCNELITDIQNRFRRVSTSDKRDFKKSLINSDNAIVIHIEDVATQEDIEIIKRIITEDIGVSNADLVRKESIYEWGASGWFTDFFINLTAGIALSALEKLYKFLKEKEIIYNDYPSIKTDQIKDYLRHNFGTSTNSLVLTKIDRIDNGQTRMILNSRYEEYTVTTNQDGEVINAERRQLTQLKI